MQKQIVVKHIRYEFVNGRSVAFCQGHEINKERILSKMYEGTLVGLLKLAKDDKAEIGNAQLVLEKLILQDGLGA